MAFLKKKTTEKKHLETVQTEKQMVLHSLRTKPGNETNGILLHPHFTEKTASGAEYHKYTFSVAKDANKINIAQAVGNRYNVTIEHVHIINIPKKQRMRGRQIGFKPGMKKAIVTIAEGQTIEIQ